jgi:hypothetical protein
MTYFPKFREDSAFPPKSARLSLNQETTRQSISSFDFLPDELIMNFFSILEIFHLTKAEQVCKRFYELSPIKIALKRLGDNDSDKFNQSAKEFIEAIVNRPLLTEESIALQLHYRCMEMPFLVQPQEDTNTVQAFYDIFQEQIMQLKIDKNGQIFWIYAAAAQKAITIKANIWIENLENPLELRAKIITSRRAFNGKVFEDMIKTYTSQPIANITIDSFKEKAAWIQERLPRMSCMNIETKLCQAVLSKHGSAVFDKLKRPSALIASSK